MSSSSLCSRMYTPIYTDETLPRHQTSAMSLKVIIVACVAVVALANKPHVYHQRPVYAVPTYHAPGPVYHAPSPYKQPEYPTVPPKYNYNYGVADGYSGANFGHSESRDGYKTEGSYTRFEVEIRVHQESTNPLIFNIVIWMHDKQRLAVCNASGILLLVVGTAGKKFGR
ncbi:uncharacterized protein LOC122249009 [Penaeus japonicus]|uniref:uncharacterized protein LOC122249009 n=1 Tax=Penaeus japonicus TaxID=27405 RepID=UPI001C71360D|nr:uncharacterized protein LOC122249009 [Penaeus japonicus]